MKKILILLALSLSVVVYAQEKLEEGILMVKVSMSSDDEQMNTQLAMVGDMESTTYFKGQKSRNENNNPMTGEIITILDNEKKEMLMLMNNPMYGKMFAKSNIEMSEEDEKGIVIKKGEESKKILGYDCDQYFVSANIQGQEMEMEIFSTKEIIAYSQQTATYGNKIEGFPLYVEMTMNQGPVKMTIVTETTDIKKELVSDDKFDMTPPKGYEEIKQ
ncbi:hypothetical protein [uncultured Lacinutrix sp.]|uniref:hypothetical protein n=1 Tax=uncultured Lacinutrix sp. TaxID=574032 RepID=UPI002611DEF2|nr:hypothetical protein [uncultured Lacinutrix sp.]